MQILLLMKKQMWNPLNITFMIAKTVDDRANGSHVDAQHLSKAASGFLTFSSEDATLAGPGTGQRFYSLSKFIASFNHCRAIIVCIASIFI